MLPVPPRPEPEQPDPTRVPAPLPVAKEPISAVVRARGVRPRSKFVAILAVALLACGAWAYWRPRPDGLPEVVGAQSVEVKFHHPWGDESPRPGAKSNDQTVISELATVLKKSERTREHKCGSRGAITLHRALGRTTELGFLAGHHPEWYEIEYERKLYRVPRAEFVAAMKRIGVDVPLTCP